MSRVFVFSAAALVLSSLCQAHDSAQVVFEDTSSLLSSYDYVIAGAGVSGLVVANRLTEDPDITVLLIEHGYFDEREPYTLVPGLARMGLGIDNAKYLFNYTSVPQPALNNRTSGIWAASAVGGGSTVNGMVFPRGGAVDYDAWEALGNPGWGWDGILPFFQKYESIVVEALAQDPAAYLLPDVDETVLEGFKAQRDILMDHYRSFEATAMEITYEGRAEFDAALQRPLSRGTILIKTADPLAVPEIDYRVYTNPVDMRVAVAVVRTARDFMYTPAMRALGVVEHVPGAAVQSDAEIEDAIRSTLGQPTFGHISGSCAMQQRAHGGVVSPRLQVYGVQGLRVIDASIMPLVSTTHLQATVYAIAEKRDNDTRASRFYISTNPLRTLIDLPACRGTRRLAQMIRERARRREELSAVRTRPLAHTPVLHDLVPEAVVLAREVLRAAKRARERARRLRPRRAHCGQGSVRLRFPGAGVGEDEGGGDGEGLELDGEGLEVDGEGLEVDGEGLEVDGDGQELEGSGEGGLGAEDTGVGGAAVAFVQTLEASCGDPG
ncbi:hypothetical protein IEO21_08219 [Rhodonia placenta]|uniref:Glucose-methanol-choline oxidoreductase N-terminal domain-containing protein n=1 Tax=Rhodonia placenta TaxID=104341 RepID=A0A8H7TZ08_9APHY|nr:hypothetical protein IEO21_08219 [Postia placenta]